MKKYVVLILLIGSTAMANTGELVRFTCDPLVAPFNNSTNGYWEGIGSTARYPLSSAAIQTDTGYVMAGSATGTGMWWAESNVFHTAFTGGSAFAVSAWVISTQDIANSVVVKITAGSDGMFILRRSTTTTNLELRGKSATGDGLMGITNASVNFAPIGSISHVVGILNFADDCALVYRNGALIASQAVLFSSTDWSIPATAQVMMFGDTGNYSWHGWGQDVRMYNYAPTAVQVFELFTNGWNELGYKWPPQIRGFRPFGKPL